MCRLIPGHHYIKSNILPCGIIEIFLRHSGRYGIGVVFLRVGSLGIGIKRRDKNAVVIEQQESKVAQVEIVLSYRAKLWVWRGQQVTGKPGCLRPMLSVPTGNHCKLHGHRGSIVFFAAFVGRWAVGIVGDTARQ